MPDDLDGRNQYLYPGTMPCGIRGKSPIRPLRLTRDLIATFRSTIESSLDERPLQKLFEDHPELLVTAVIGPHITWVFERLKLPTAEGGLRVPDFMICDWTSIGPKWTIVELESPRERKVSNAGLSSKLNHAREQIVDYRLYLSKYAQLTRDADLPGMHLPNEAVIVIGRRGEEISETNRERLADMRRENIEVSSYDRLLEHATNLYAFWGVE